MNNDQNKSHDQDGIEESNSKRVNEYKGGKAKKPKAQRMKPTDAMIAATTTAQQVGDKVKEMKTIFDSEVEEAKTIIYTFNDAAQKVPTWIPARLDDKSQAAVDKLQKSIDTADFTRQLRQGLDKATMGLLGEHKTAAWAIVICSVLLCVAFACLAVSTAVKQGRAEAQVEQYKADAMNWRQFSAENPRTAARFLKQKE